MATLIDVAALKDRMDAGKRTVLLDVRWVLGDPHGHSHFRQAHIPGAVYVDLHHELADPTAEGQGRHPLPPTATERPSVGHQRRRHRGCVRRQRQHRSGAVVVAAP
jgi:3-mercaptopyruvate sulfurtransferase SseA